MYDSITVANRLLARARDRGDSLTPMQVLKLVYIAHGWTLGLLGRPLIRDEIQAWEYGPVIPRLYNAMRHFRSNPVEVPLPYALTPHVDGPEGSIVDQVYDIYGKRSGPALSRLTHLPGSPWYATYRSGSFWITIPNDIIEDHYARLAAAHREKA